MERKIIGPVLGSAVAIAVVLFVSYWFNQAPAPGVPSPHPHFEAFGTVMHVIDGDTISVHMTWVHNDIGGVDAGSDKRVRLSGGIDAPELEQEGGPEATSFIIGLCPIGTKVLLDLDNLASGGAGPYQDPFGRLLAVVYVWTDNAWVNINAELLGWGLEAWPQHDWLKYADLPSEFDPDEWLAENYPYVCGRAL